MSKNFNISNPGELPPDVLVENFVVRLGVFKKIMQEIRGSDMSGAIQHYLIVGQRGMGKTTLLYRLRYEIENDKKLSWLIPVTFTEEQYEIYDLGGLWESIARFLQEVHPTEFGNLYDSMEEHLQNENFSELGFNMLIDQLKKNKKKLVLLVDNFGMLLANIGDKEVHRLREILMKNKFLRLVASSTLVLEQTISYDKPFFEFFEELRLEGLDAKETIEVIRQLAIRSGQQEKIEKIIKEEPHRIEAIRRLTGGVIRTIVILFEILADSKDGKVLNDLEGVLDKVTDMYKNRIEILKPQQRKIVDAVARIWDGATVKEIMKEGRLTRMGLKANQVSSQLKQLADSQIMEIDTSTVGKNSLYRLRERFFNIWYLMRSTRKYDKQRVKWLIRFFEIWCSKDELGYLVSCQIDAFKKGDYPHEAAYFRSLALAQVVGLEEDKRKELVSATFDYLRSPSPQLAQQFIRHFTERLVPYDKSEYSASDKKLLDIALSEYEKKNYQKALETLLKITNQNAFVLAGIGTQYFNLRQLDLAVQYNLKALHMNDSQAAFNLGFIYHYELKVLQKAEQYYLKALEMGNSKGAVNLGLLYKFDFKNFKKAEKYFLKALDMGDPKAAFNLGLINEFEFKDFKMAEQYYLKALGAGNFRAATNLGNLYYFELGDYKKAERYYLKALDMGESMAALGLGFLYESELEDYEKAEQYYLKALKMGNLSAAANLGFLYEFQFQNFKKSEKYYLKAIESGDSSVINNLAYLYHTKLEEPLKAEYYYKKDLESGNHRAAVGLFLLYGKEIHKPLSETISIVKPFIYSRNLKENDFDWVSNVLQLLLAKNQYHFVLNYFNDVEKQYHLKDRLKPLYYATLYFLKDEYPNEYKKAGPELKETIKEIVQLVESYRKEFEQGKKKNIVKKKNK